MTHVDPALSGPSERSRALSSLERIERRLARLEASLERVERLAQHVEPAVLTAVDALDDAARRATDRGVDLDQRLHAVLRVADALARPETVLVLERTLSLAEQAPAALGTVMDSVDSIAQRAADAGIDLEERLRVIARVAERLTTPSALRVAETLVDHLEPLERLLTSGVLASGPVEVVSKAGEALAGAQGGAPPEPVGAWGTLRALRDPDVQMALGFALAFARRFGSALNAGSDRPALVEHTTA